MTVELKPAVRVKPLEWRDSYSVIRADTEFGSYKTSASGKILTLGIAPMSPQMVCANLDAAKAAAQADYERRILSAIEPIGVAEAAKVLLDERDEADRRAGAAERKRDQDSDELVRLRFWKERVKGAIGLSLNDSADKVIPMIERLSALANTETEKE